MGGAKRRRRWGFGRTGLVLVLALAVAGLATLPWLLRGPASHPGAAVPLPGPGAVPLDYHIVYRVTTAGVVSTEELWVHRPFQAEDLVFAGGAARGQPISSIVDRLGRELVHTGGTPGLFEPPARPTQFDVRLDPVADAAVADGALSREGRLVVAGRPCQVLRSAQSLLSGSLAGRPTAGDHVDTCVDAQGLVLQERRIAKGKVVQERRATAVQAGPDAAGHSYLTSGNRIPLSQGGGAVVTISDDSRPPGATFWQAPEPPAGFSHLGRFAVIPPQPVVDPTQARSILVTAIDDVFVRDADVVVVEQGQTLGATPLQPPTEGSPVDLGRLGPGRLALSAGASSVTALTKRSSFVRVSGTVPPEQLEAVARSLQPLPPGTIVTVPDLTSDGA